MSLISLEKTKKYMTRPEFEVVIVQSKANSHSQWTKELSSSVNDRSNFEDMKTKKGEALDD